MATSTISNTLTGPTGTALSGVPIIIRLVPREGFRITDNTQVAPVYTTTTNGSGVWTAALERNSNITPANSYYEVEQQLTAAQGGPRKVTFQVGATDQTLNAARISAIPDLTTANYLTQAAADARYMQLTSGFGTSGSMIDSRPADTASAGTADFASRIDHRHDRETIYGTAAERAALSGNDIYNGLRWVESDTGLMFIRLAGTWIQCGSYGASQTWTPTLTQLGTVPKSLQANQCTYTRFGRQIIGRYGMDVTGAGGTGANTITISLPVAASSSDPFNYHVGTGQIYDASAAIKYRCLLVLASTTTVKLLTLHSTTDGFLGATDFTAALASTDIVTGQFQYEAGSAS